MNFGVDFKNEDEVKDYLKNIHVEYQFGCNHEKNPETCHLLGDYYEGVTRDLPAAANTYKDNCDSLNFGKSCAKYGAYVMFGRGTNAKPDPKKAYDYFEKACKLGDPKGCFNQGFVLSTPGSHVYDPVKSIECFKKSCSEKYAEACYFLSGMYIQGVKNKPAGPHAAQPPANNEEQIIVPKNMKEAFMYTNTACELQHIYACANLSQMYTRGEGVEKNEELGAKFKELTLKLKSEIKGVDFQRGLS